MPDAITGRAGGSGPGSRPGPNLVGARRRAPGPRTVAGAAARPRNGWSGGDAVDGLPEADREVLLLRRRGPAVRGDRGSPRDRRRSSPATVWPGTHSASEGPTGFRGRGGLAMTDGQVDDVIAALVGQVADEFLARLERGRTPTRTSTRPATQKRPT